MPLGWRYRRKITINHKGVSGSDQTDFPVLFSLTDADLKLDSHGGHVAQSQGEDILFTSSNCSMKLDHEIEKYDPLTGELKVWIRVPTLSHVADTVLYLYYGNPTCGPQQNKYGVWSSNYRMVLHLNRESETCYDSTSFRNDGVRKERVDGSGHYFEVPHSNSLNITTSITVEAWVESESLKTDCIQSIVSKWSSLTTLSTFEAYDAGNTSGLNTKGFFGAVFDGRYIYFIPQHDGLGRHGKVLRYDTQGPFTDSESWSVYDAGNVSGLNTKGYYGGVFDGRYIYFTPRTDGLVHHSRVLRYDTHGEFRDEKSWCAYDVGIPVSHQGAAFDGRYIYFPPGYEGDYEHSVPSGKVLRYDTHGDFTDGKSYTIYDAGNTGGLETKCYDGAVFDGRYVYFAPLDCVGMMLRYDTYGEFTDGKSWSAYDAGNTMGLSTVGFNGGAFDGRYVYFAPWREGTGPDGKIVSHGRVLRYDTTGENASFSLRYTDHGHNGGLCGALPGPSFIVNTPKGVLNVRANRNLKPGLHMTGVKLCCW
ncbi:MAG: DUF2341 domain-containing protein [Candidatus Bathyarchaeia archaeon]